MQKKLVIAIVALLFSFCTRSDTDEMQEAIEALDSYIPEDIKTQIDQKFSSDTLSFNPSDAINKNKADDTDQNIKDHGSVMLTFASVKTYDGSLYLVFEDNDGEKFNFFNFNIPIDTMDLYYRKPIGNSGQSAYVANPEKVGKNYMIFFLKDSNSSSFNGMDKTVIGLVEEGKKWSP